jgi:hypothetical protein
MDENKLKEQRRRLRQVKPQEWQKALDRLTEEMSNSKLLGGHVEDGPHNTKRLVYGRTQYGAHSEMTLGTNNVLYHYQTEFVLALYEGQWEWKKGVSLADQLVEIAYSRIPKAVDKYVRKKEREKKDRINTTPISLDVDMIGKPDDYTGEETETMVAAFNYKEPEPNNPDLDGNEANEGNRMADYDDATADIPDERYGVAIMNKEQTAGMDYQHHLWETVCSAADGDPELERFVQTTGQSQTMQEVNTALNLQDGERDRLQKRLQRKVNKLKY